MRRLVPGLGMVLGLYSAPALADHNLEKPFAATASDLLAAAKSALPGDWPVVILREDKRTDFDDRNRAVEHFRRVFVVRTQAGVDDWGTVGTSWSPFYQDKPVMRVRVVDPAGKITEIDQSLIADSPTVDTSPTVYSDQRDMRGPLPRLQIGSVVEEEIVTKDREPLLAAGTVKTERLGSSIPRSSLVVTFSVPVARHAKHVERALPAGLRAKHITSGGRETWTYELANVAAQPEAEVGVPGDVIRSPYVGVATAASWNEVARGYRKLLDQRLVDGPFTLPSALPRVPSLETARVIVAWLHHEIRYTGIEFGEASITPWPPAETTKRGFGDCKDTATLLVTLLRQAGIRADLALLSTGPGLDVDLDLPGMGVFDHAIVRARIGTTDLWIDATEDLVAVGELPARDQGRRALVVADDTTTLVLTPQSRPADNTAREVRNFELSETGEARVVETSVATGILDHDRRDWLRDTRAEDLRKGLAKYVESEYLGKLDHYTSTPAGNLTRPLELTVVVTDTNRAYTYRDHIEVRLFASDTLVNLPDIVDGDQDGKAPRRLDFAWYRPHVVEIENRLLLPPGYTAPSLVAEQIRNLGSATLTTRRRVDGRTVIVTYRFETGKLRLTPAELATLQHEIGQLRKETEKITIQHTGSALSERGKHREAIAEIERLIKLHPKEALHQTELASAYMAIGAGAAARRAARAAVALEPKNADTHVMLAWTLRSDTLGRQYGFDHDRAGAIAEYKLARVLNPKHVGAAHDLAILLERDARGALVWGEQRDTIDAWKAARTLDDTTENALGLLSSLVRAGDPAAETLALSLPTSIRRDTLLVAAVSAGPGGVAAAVGTASSLRTGSERTQIVDSAAYILMLRRQYDLTRKLSAETGSQKAGTPLAQIIQRLTRHELIKPTSKDPREAVVALFYAVIDPDFVPPIVDSAFAAELRLGVSNVNAQFDTIIAAGSREYVWDYLDSVTDARIEGGPRGPWRVESDTLGIHVITYVALDAGVAKVIATHDRPSAAASYLLRLPSGSEDARTVLDWLRKDIAPATHHNLSGLWGGSVPRDKEAVALAISTLGGDPSRNVPILTRCASTVSDARTTCDTLLAETLIRGAKWKDLVSHTVAWETRKDPHDLAPYIRAVAQRQLGNFDAADQGIDAILAKRPDFLPATRYRVEIALARGQFAEAIKRYDFGRSPTAAAEDLNNLAWLLAFERSDLIAARDLANRSSQAVKDDSNTQNTLAVIEAELGDLSAAKADGWKAMDLGRRRKPNDADWYLIGRVFEQLGLRDDARAAYLRIAKSKDVKVLSAAPTSYDFARRQLAALGVK